MRPKPNGVAACWGYNGSGQVGDGTTTNRLTPTLVTGIARSPRSPSGSSQFVCAQTEQRGLLGKQRLRSAR
ncbi:RCC1 domain-containing protein [Candidatus Microthrix sp.]|uniref:RCC1 domain-containing protein n=1 Tax=Candidatus Neomicrothrix sp. TaxID=2719034 RepID=UPI002A4E134A|nr:RCC1 domain-containing protein [Candidatus Microthrix sp.]